MAAADGFQGRRIELVHHPALHILETFRTGNVQRIAFRAHNHFVQAVSQIAFNDVGLRRGGRFRGISSGSGGRGVLSGAAAE